MRSQYIFKAPFLSSDEIKLGNLIPNIRDPELDAQECPWPIALNEDYTVKLIDNFHAFFRSERNVQLSGFLSRLVNVSGQRTTANNDELSSARGNIHTLKKPNAFFQKLCKDQDVRVWLQEQIEDGLDVHFVVGFVTLLNARAADGTSSSNAFKGQGSIPVTEVLAGGVPNDLLDVRLAGGYSSAEANGRSYLAPGEQIFGLRVKKLVFKFFRSRSVATAKLEKNTSWELVSGNRAASQQGSEWVQASLAGDEIESGDEVDESDVGFAEDDEFILLDDGSDSSETEQD
ncbi:hypothetical protein P170DRAFT_436443 [Aspergillus steynii IBT 23096]|uniref:Uncharacterized protein n=1 Tax=Aspergillus steynii IBT 23096 TaxID=1392250 RepID=A0A2I2G6Y4_9EURO|nr:uncharacterized protein P170DRAFT_436443 [Aspergillus steynii IBT 23096]PLB48630.1 hypothetical protein P170DRAFT_436443 [Aspergillus steynii IBT 23096]